jgi:hypothetical protein
MDISAFILEILETARQRHGIDPIIFGLLYFGTIPLFMASTAWLLRNIRMRKPVIFPVLFSVLFWMAAYLYLALAGNNIPCWVYLMIAIAALTALGSTWVALRSSRPGNSQKKSGRGR